MAAGIVALESMRVARTWGAAAALTSQANNGVVFIFLDVEAWAPAWQ
jgi:hypothetical protein